MSGVEAKMISGPSTEKRKLFDRIRGQLDDLKDTSIRVSETAHDVKFRLIGVESPPSSEPEMVEEVVPETPVSQFILNRISSIRASIEEAEELLDKIRSEL